MTQEAPDSQDFSAAMTEIEPDFAAALIPKKRGRKKKQTPETQETLLLNIYNIDGSNEIKGSTGIIEDNPKILESIDIKDKLTQQEITFLELLFNSPRKKGDERLTIDKCMISAGYGDYHINMRYRLAKKIVLKYERATPDAGNILQALGFGKIKAAQHLIDKVENAKSEQVSLNALALALKMLRMIEEKQDNMQGIQINIITQPAPGTAPAPGAPASVVIQGQPGQQPATAPRKPLQISR